MVKRSLFPCVFLPFWWHASMEHLTFILLQISWHYVNHQKHLRNLASIINLRYEWSDSCMQWRRHRVQTNPIPVPLLQVSTAASGAMAPIVSQQPFFTILFYTVGGSILFIMVYMGISLEIQRRRGCGDTLPSSIRQPNPLAWRTKPEPDPE